MIRTYRLMLSAAVLGVLLLPGVSTAQNAALESNQWSHGTTLNVLAGVAGASSDNGPVAGASVGWEITPRFGVEGSGAWFDRHHDAHAFAADVKAQVALTSPRLVVPFVGVGVGVYRASFDLTQGSIPDFYGRRLAADAALSTTATFRDLAGVFGAGVNIYLTSHLAIRPDIHVLLLRNGSENYVVTTFLVHLAYHFEQHPMEALREPRSPQNRPS